MKLSTQLEKKTGGWGSVCGTTVPLTLMKLSTQLEKTAGARGSVFGTTVRLTCMKRLAAQMAHGIGRDRHVGWVMTQLPKPASPRFSTHPFPAWPQLL